jgi:ribonuclease R
MIPVSTLGDDVFLLDERHHALVGQRFGETFGLGDIVKVMLAEADPILGQLSFRLEEHERAHGAELARAAWKKGRGGSRRLPARRRR